MADHNSFEPIFELELSQEAHDKVLPFFTNLDKNVYAIPLLPPEVVGALCSRSSRAKGDLRQIFYEEFIAPFLEGDDEYAVALRNFIEFLQKYPVEVIFSNPKGREFYVKWLAQYGDDSIAQMAGTHLVFSGLSQLAIKHFEDQRIGLAPIEKSTRYVDYSTKIKDSYLYYTDPRLKEWGLEAEYKQTMDFLFDTYTQIAGEYLAYLQSIYPDEKSYVLKTKAYDTVRGLLPMATLGQVAFFGNGQSFEYAIHRALHHPLGEINWAASASLEELKKVIPAFVRRLEGEQAAEYSKYRLTREETTQDIAQKIKHKQVKTKDVELLEYDTEGEAKVITALLYPHTQVPFAELLETVTAWPDEQKIETLDSILKGRTQRWYKLPRAFENAYMRFEITMNIGSWRDLHRHRMQTQFKQAFTPTLGYDIPPELQNTPLGEKFEQAVHKAEELYKTLYVVDPLVAQYAVTMAHKVRFVQFQNVRSFFWEAELRTTSQGHPNYRRIEHEKIALFKKAYPLLARYLQADMNEYTFARRGNEERAEKRAATLSEYLTNVHQTKE